MKLLLVCILALVFVAQEAKSGPLKSKRSAQEDFAAAAGKRASSEESNSEESAESEESDESNESQERVKRDAKSSKNLILNRMNLQMNPIQTALKKWQNLKIKSLELLSMI